MTVDSPSSDRERCPALQLQGIAKRFGPQLALDAVDFEVGQAEVHGLLGENGAGKTTLMNIASGLLRMDEGTISVQGQQVNLSSPADAFAVGIGMVHQNYRLVERMTVAQNLHIGWSETPRLASSKALQRHAAELGERFELAVDPAARISDLSIGERQRVAILRTVARGARLLILDEPTAVLTPQEAASLFKIIRAMAADGRSVVLISHKLNEVMQVADRVTVLRHGKRIASLPRGECDVAKLARLMIGHDIVPERYLAGEPTDTVLDVESLVALSDDGRRLLDNLSFSVRRGEIVGVAGVSGNGQSELAQVLTGLQAPAEGVISVAGADLTGSAPVEFIKAGVGHIAEHHRRGLATTETAQMNAVIKDVHVPPIRRGPFLNRRSIRTVAEGILDAANLSGRAGVRVATFSGGQMQRLMVHREVAATSSLLVAMYPTRGLDVAATEHVHDLLRDVRARGAGVLLVSEDLNELLVVSDRILVIYDGQIVGQFARDQVDRDELGLLMGGAKVGADRGGGEAVS
ncbi:MAG: ABC transporter ATP-binding protein [Actinobacteria bacterium]|nr:ABC transporter ATP-binding protein [Actinomycetota bacterium]